MAEPVRKSVKQIDEHSWLIGDKIILRRRRSAPARYLWKDSDGSWYVLANATKPLPPAGPLPSDTHIRLVYDTGDACAVWSFGDALLKVKLTTEAHDATATPEHVTLEWLARHKLSFAVPRLLHHRQAGDRKYLFISRVPGTVLADAWRTMDRDLRQHYARRIVEIAGELSAWQSDAVTGIDGGELADTWLDVGWAPRCLQPHTLRETCRDLGMDCSKFYFWHCDLGPYNVMVDPARKGAVGLVDWEAAGFVPREWIRTKFGVSYGMNFAWSGVHRDEPALREWRELVEREFGKAGYPEVKEAYKKWFMERYSMRAK